VNLGSSHQINGSRSSPFHFEMESLHLMVRIYLNEINGLFGWGGFGLMDLDLRTQIQILCLDDLKPLRFGFGPNPFKILKTQIHGFQMTS
jgi:hypothetical protein